MKLARFLLMGATAALLSACSSDCNPGKAGFVSGLGCSLGGGYQQRETNLRQGAAQAQSEALVEQMNAARAQNEAFDAQKSLEQARQEMAQLDSTLDDLNLRLETLRKRASVDRTALHRAENDYKALREQQRQRRIQLQTQSPTQAAPTRAEIESFRAREDRLLEALDRMM